MVSQRRRRFGIGMLAVGTTLVFVALAGSGHWFWAIFQLLVQIAVGITLWNLSRPAK